MGKQDNAKKPDATILGTQARITARDLDILLEQRTKTSFASPTLVNSRYSVGSTVFIIPVPNYVDYYNGVIGIPLDNPNPQFDIVSVRGTQSLIVEGLSPAEAERLQGMFEAAVKKANFTGGLKGKIGYHQMRAMVRTLTTSGPISDADAEMIGVPKGTKGFGLKPGTVYPVYNEDIGTKYNVKGQQVSDISHKTTSPGFFYTTGDAVPWKVNVIPHSVTIDGKIYHPGKNGVVVMVREVDGKRQVRIPSAADIEDLRTVSGEKVVTDVTNPKRNVTAIWIKNDGTWKIYEPSETVPVAQIQAEDAERIRQAKAAARAQEIQRAWDDGVERLWQGSRAMAGVNGALTALMLWQRNEILYTDMQAGGNRGAAAGLTIAAATGSLGLDGLALAGVLSRRLTAGAGIAGLGVNGLLILEDYERHDGRGMAFNTGALVFGASCALGTGVVTKNLWAALGAGLACGYAGGGAVAYGTGDWAQKKISENLMETRRQSVAEARKIGQYLLSAENKQKPLNAERDKQLTEVIGTFIGDYQATLDQPVANELDQKLRAKALQTIGNALVTLYQIHDTNMAFKIAQDRPKYLEKLQTLIADMNSGVPIDSTLLGRFDEIKTFFKLDRSRTTDISGYLATLTEPKYQAAKAQVDGLLNVLNKVWATVEHVQKGVDILSRPAQRAAATPAAVQQAVASLSTPVMTGQPASYDPSGFISGVQGSAGAVRNA